MEVQKAAKEHYEATSALEHRAIQEEGDVHRIAWLKELVKEARKDLLDAQDGCHKRVARNHPSGCFATAKEEAEREYRKQRYTDWRQSSLSHGGFHVD